MSPAMASALRSLIAADRMYRSKEGQSWMTANDRGCEVGPMGMDPRTARALETLGLCEQVQIGTISRAFLGEYAPTDDFK